MEPSEKAHPAKLVPLVSGATVVLSLLPVDVLYQKCAEIPVLQVGDE